MAKNNRLTKGEYQNIRVAYMKSRALHPRKEKVETIELVAAQFSRSPQTVMRVVTTKGYEGYQLFSLIERRRNPVTTLGRQVRELKKRQDKVEAHLFATGVVKGEKA